MIVRALDADGDWTFGSGLNNYKSANNAVAQSLQTRCNSFLGNCFFDQGAGIDWFGFLGGKNELGLNLAIAAVILNTSNVISMIELSTNVTSSREFSASYQVQTTYSTVSNVIQIQI